MTFKEPVVGYLLGGSMLLAAFLTGLVHFFSEIETKPGEVPTIVVIVMLVVIAVIVMIAGRCYTAVNENGVLWGSDFGKKQIAWTDVEKVGIDLFLFCLSFDFGWISFVVCYFLFAA